MQTLHTDDGLRLVLRHWPAAEAARGNVILVHGLGEHIGRYAHVADYLTRCGWNVIGYDQRGHGASTGRRGAIARSDALLRDLGQVVALARAQHDGPLVLVGHSMGGLVAGRYVAEGLAASPAPWYQPVDGLVMSSPALAVPMNAVQKAMLTVLGPLVPGLPAGNGLKPGWVSRDPQVVKAYRDDPLVHDRITPRLARFIVDEGAAVRARAAGWSVPTLLLWAGADRCVAPHGSRAFADAAPRQALQAQCFEPLFHEIFNEPEQGEVLQHVGRWLQQDGCWQGQRGH